MANYLDTVESASQEVDSSQDGTLAQDFSYPVVIGADPIRSGLVTQLGHKTASAPSANLILSGKTAASLQQSNTPPHPSRVSLFSRFGRKAGQREASPKRKGPLGLNTLYDPGDEATLVDIIFVHGLGGDSIKTWSGTHDPESYWPQSWLPADPDFRQARTHSFGYDADWRNRSMSILSIHDLAQSLLGEVRNHPSIRRSQTQIILVGHSMGGCIAKKLYVLVREDPSAEQLASRIHSIFFLGTPHRGSNLAKLMSNVLMLTGVAKPYLVDLSRDSKALSELSTSFQPFAPQLRIWSFFETRPITERPEVLVVDKFCATLGYSNEEISAMDANHRQLCKFKNPLDPSYRKLRNALSSAVDLIKLKSDNFTSSSSRITLETYLNVNDSFEDDLSICQETKHPGSCTWFTKLDEFLNWLTGGDNTPSVLWLTGQMGSGKSIISSHVTEFLNHHDQACSYYFFKQGQTGSVGLSSLLTHLLYQMALQDTAVRRQILRLQQESVSWQPQDERSIWKKLFVEGIFLAKRTLSHFWVIDGLDECSGASMFFKIITQLPPWIRTFVTSRGTPEIERGISSLSSCIHLYPLQESDTVSDIQSVIQSALTELALDNTSDIRRRLLARSSGSFIWIRLVLQELETAFTNEDVEEILNEVPNGLFDMYERVLKAIETDRRRAKFAKSILLWVTLVIRPLTIEELQHAIQLDLSQTPQKMEQTILLSCGQLVTIDQSRRVHLIHETARGFLLSEGLCSSLAIAQTEGHARLASISLSYLENLFTCHTPFKSLQGASAATESDFLRQYTSTSFSKHILKSGHSDRKLFNMLLKFMDERALFWIEVIAENRDLTILSSTSIDLANYLDQIVHGPSPTELQRLKGWIADLSRVATSFRDQLKSNPAAIHHIIPPLCPPTSVIAQRFGNLPTSFNVCGLQSPSWTDCHMQIIADWPLTSVAFGERYFALGTAVGDISIYDANFLQHRLNVSHTALEVYRLEFGCEDKFLASVGNESVMVWDPISGALLFDIPCTTSCPLAILFAKRSLMIALKRGLVLSVILITGEVTSHRWIPDLDNTIPSILRENNPLEAVFSDSSQGLLAATFFTSGVYIFDANFQNLRGVCCGEGNVIVRTMVFHPKPQRTLLIVSYTGGGSLAVFDVSTMTRLLTIPAVFAVTLTCSPDGRFLIAGTKGGIKHAMEIYEFGGYDDDISLSLVYSANYPARTITALAARKSGLQFASIHVMDCEIWQPLTLLDDRHSEVEPGACLSDSNISKLLYESSEAHMDTTRGEITSIVLSGDGNTALCGSETGKVWAFATSDGSKLDMIFQTHHQSNINAISSTERGDDDFIIIADLSKRLAILEVKRSPRRWSEVTSLIEKETLSTTEQILLSPSKEHILILSWLSPTEILEFPSGNLVQKKMIPKFKTKLRAARNCPSDDKMFMIFEDDTLHMFHWSTFELAHKMRFIRDGNFVPSSLSISVDQHQSQDFLVEILSDAEILPNVAIVSDLEDDYQFNCWAMSEFHPSENSNDIRPQDGLHHLTSVLRAIIHVSGSTMIFLDKHLWVCSVDLTTFASTSLAKRYFFILPQWTDAKGKVRTMLTLENDLIFVNKQSIIVIKKWMAFSQTVRLSLDAKDWEVVSRRTRDATLTSAMQAMSLENS